MRSERLKMGLLVACILVTVFVLWLLYTAQFGGKVFYLPL